MYDLGRWKQAQVFSGFDDSDVDAIVSLGQEKTFCAGEVIFNEGEPGRYLYIVMDGIVSIHCGDKFIAKCRNNEAFGEMATLHKRLRSATARATTDVRALSFGEEDVERLLKPPQAVQFLLNIIGLLSARLEVGNAWVASSMETQRR